MTYGTVFPSSKVNRTVVFHPTLILYALRLGVRLVRFVMCFCMFGVSVILDQGLSLAQSSKELSGRVNAKTGSFFTFIHAQAPVSTAPRGPKYWHPGCLWLCQLCLCLAQPHVPMWPAKARLFHNAFQSSYYSETPRTGMVSSAVQGPYCRGSGWLWFSQIGHRRGLSHVPMRWVKACPY